VSRNVIFDEEWSQRPQENLEEKEPPTVELGGEFADDAAAGPSHGLVTPPIQRSTCGNLGQPLERFGFADPRVHVVRDDDDLGVVLLTEDGDPSSYSEAMASPDKNKWIEAMEKEMDSLKKNSTWRLVDFPKGKKLVQKRWVYKKKQDGTYKARLVAKGYTQKKGMDYNEIFSPVVKLSTIRTLLAMVAFYDLELDQMDVVTAFLHGLLDVEIYMAQPEGFCGLGPQSMSFVEISLWSQTKPQTMEQAV